MGQRDLRDAMAESIIHTDKAHNMQFCVDTKAGHTVLNARNWKLENSSQPLEGRLLRHCTTPLSVAIRFT